jgi:hypothetical protein
MIGNGKNQENLALAAIATRYQLFTDDQAARLLGVSQEAARSQARRIQKKGLLTREKAAGGVSYWRLTARGGKRLGVSGRGPRSGRAAFTALGITEFFAESGCSLLTPVELTGVFCELKKSAGLDLDVRGVHRSLFFWQTPEELSRIRVDLTLPLGFNARLYLKGVERKRRALRAKSEGWKTLIDSQGLSFTVLSPIDRSYQFMREAEKTCVLIHTHTIPLLTSAWGVDSGVA